MDATFLFAQNFLKSNYSNIPENAVEVVKKHTLDILGVALAGSSKQGVKEALELYSEWSGRPEGTVICFGKKLPVVYAAQINATMGHALDYDDTHDLAVIHPSVIVIPTCFAMAEFTGELSGRDFIAIAATGMDMICRLGLATTSPKKAAWHLTTLYGFITAAAIAGKILGLGEEGMINAMGIAYHQACGNGQCVLDGALTKRMGPGFAVNGGITAALMAKRGITGARNSIEGQFGLYNMYHNGIYDRNALVQNIGTVYEGVNTSIKPYPCCRGIHAYIDAAKDIVDKYNLKPADIEKIIIVCSKVHNQVLCSPLEVKIRPNNIVDAQFSTPWGIATIIAEKRVSLDHFTETAIRNTNILEVAQKIKVEIEDNPAITHVIEPGKVKIITTDGKSYYSKKEYALGSPQSPLNYEQCAEKFFNCSSYAVKQLPKKNLNKVVELIRDLENVNDVRQIVRLLS